MAMAAASLIGSSSAWAAVTSYCVSGAGTAAADGTYTLNAGDGYFYSATYPWYIRSAGPWMLINGSTSFSHYYVPAASGLTGTWVTDGSGTAPAPTVTEGDCVVAPAAITVSSTAATGAGSLRQAIIDIADGGTITIDPSLSAQTILMGTGTADDYAISGKSVTIDASALATPLTLAGQLAHRIFTFDGTGGKTLTLKGLSFMAGKTSAGSADGGAIRASGGGVLVINGCTFISNQTAGTGAVLTGDGGAIFLDGANASIINSTFNDNYGANGGAIAVTNNAALTLGNSTLQGNYAYSDNGVGGGVYLDGTSTANLTYSTVSGNHADGTGTGSGGGLGGTGAYTLSRSIVAGNNCVSSGCAADLQPTGNYYSSGYNLTGTTAIVAITGSGTDIVGQNADLGSLASNGGKTLTLKPNTGSPAIGAIPNANCNASGSNSTDQTGASRPLSTGVTCTIGAVEKAAPTTPSVSSITSAGSPATSATSMNFTVVFSEAVSGVDASDFTLTATPSAAGTIGTPTTSDGITWTVPINSISGFGTLRLNLNGSGTGIAATAAGNAAIGSGFTGGTTHTLNTTATAAVMTLAGGGSAGGILFGSADGSGTAATFHTPTSVAVDGSGNVYVADMPNNLIRKITPAGVVSTLAGGSSAGHADGTGTAATFSSPYGIAVDSSGNNIYVADYDFNLIRKITSAGVVTTLAGGGSVGGTASGHADGNGTAATFWGPDGIAVDGSGNIYVADYKNNLIRKIDSSGNVTTLAGGGSVGGTTAGHADGSGSAATFNGPYGMAVDSGGNVYVADYNNKLIRKITSAGVVTTLAGGGSAGGILSGYADGNGTAAKFNFPQGVAVDSSGNVYVADGSNNLIRKIDSSGNVTTLAGGGSVGGITSGHADGSGTAATFNNPQDVAVDGSGNVYVADGNNNLIRKVIPAAPPAAPSVSSIALVGSPAVNATSVSFTVVFSEAVSGVDASDFTLSAMGSVSGAIGTPTSSDNITWTVPITGLSGNGLVRLDLNSSGTGIVATAAGNTAISGGFTGGSDHTVLPSSAGTDITRTFDTAATDFTSNFTQSSPATGTFTWGGAVGLGGSGGVSIGAASDQIWTTTQGYTVTADGVYKASIYFKNDLNSGYGALGFSTQSQDSNAGSYGAPNGSSIGVFFHSGGGGFINNGPIKSDGTAAANDGPLVWSNGGIPAADHLWYKVEFTATAIGGNKYDLNIKIYSSANDGTVGSLITEHTLTDNMGDATRVGPAVTNANVGGASSLYAFVSTQGSRMSAIDNFRIQIGPNPTVSSIAPAGSPAASATSMNFTVVFSEAVSGVDAGDFTLTAVGGGAGTIGTPTTTDNITWAVPISGISGTGTLRLDLNSSGTGIAATAAGNAAISGGFTSGTTHTAAIIVAAPDPVPVTAPDPVPVAVPDPVPVAVPDPVPLAPIVAPTTGTNITTINTGGSNVPVLQTGTVVVTATAPNQALLATTQTTTGTGGTSTTMPAIVVTANQTGATATGSGGTTAAPSIQVTGSTTVTVQAGAQVSGTVLNLAPPATGTTGTTATINVGGQTLTVAPSASGGSAQVTFTTVDIGGVPTPVLAVTGGSASLTANSPGQPMLAMGGGNAVTAGSCSSSSSNVVTRHDEQGNVTEATVTTCYIVLPSGAFRSTRATSERRLWAGEQALWDQNGVLTAVRLGSSGANQGWLGDPIVTPTIAGLSFVQTGPKLDGVSQRSGVNLRDSLFAQLGTLNLTLSSSTDSFGAFSVGDGFHTYSGMAVGKVAVDVTGTTANGMSRVGNGSFAFTQDSVTITVAPAVADLAAMANFVKQMGGTTTVQADGTYLVEIGASKYVLQAGYEVTPNAGSEGLGKDNADFVTYTDPQGRKQTLYPAAADFATLKAEVLKLDANATLRGKADGTIVLTLNGQSFTLMPAYALVTVPAAHAHESWWIETDGMVYLRIPSLNKAQAFTVE